LARLDADALAAAVGAWLADRERVRSGPATTRRRAVAVDGKTLRGARTGTAYGDGRPVHLLATMDHTTRAVLAQRQVGGAPEEVTAFAPLLAPLDLDGTVVTTDALQTHPQAAEFLVTEKRAHYLFVVKANQPTLLDRCQRLPWHRVPELDRTRDRGHGRIEIRTLKAVSVSQFGFPHAAQVLRVTRKTRNLDASPRRFRTVTVYAITSLPFEQAVQPGSPTCCAGTGRSRRCTTSATPASPRMPPRSAPAPLPTPWPACATWSSGCSAGPGRSTSPPRCAATPAIHADPWPRSGSASDETRRHDRTTEPWPTT
jgi:predicted transposase YbfD/YdcC